MIVEKAIPEKCRRRRFFQRVPDEADVRGVLISESE